MTLLPTQQKKKNWNRPNESATRGRVLKLFNQGGISVDKDYLYPSNCSSYYWVYNLIRAVFFSKFERSKPHELSYRPNRRCRSNTT